jgi:Icc-related predicted phosphoesterase
MRIYAVADLHGRRDRLEAIAARIRHHEPDVLALAGDIAGFGTYRLVLARLGELGIPIVGVTGNSDCLWARRRPPLPKGLHLLHGHRITLGDIAFAGLSGTLPLPFASRIGFNEAALLARLDRLVDAHTVVLVHPPPRGFFDTVLNRFSVGSARLARWIWERRPAVVLCGHVHGMSGALHLGSSLVVNCSMGGGHAGWLIEFNAGARAHAEPV